MTNRMIIGDRNRVVYQNKSEILRFNHNDRAFVHVVNFLTGLYGFVGLIELYKPDEKGARPWAMTDVAMFDAKACNSRLVWSPHHVVEPMMYNSWPRFVEFEYFQADKIENGSLDLGVLDRYLFGLAQSMITSFFESQKEEMRRKYLRSEVWPPVWNFARVIRNAMAHDGKVRINDSTKVSWKSVSYSNFDNGRIIVNVDIWPGDFFFLMREMQDLL